MAARIFLTLPEKGSSTEPTSYLFIAKDTPKIDEDNLRKVVSMLEDIYFVFDNEEISYYYDDCNVKKYLEFFSKGIKYPSPERKLRRVLYNCDFQNIRNNIQTKTTDDHKIYENVQNQGINILSEVATMQIADPYSSFVIINDTIRKDLVCAKINNFNTELQIRSSDFKQVFLWICENRKPARQYNWNPKHGEYGKNIQANKGEYVSPLLCSKDYASEILKFAIGTRNSRMLYVFDKQQKYFMEYKQESDIVDNGTHSFTYHSYHLVRNEDKGAEVDRKFEVLAKYNL